MIESFSDIGEIATVRIELLGSDPLIWREVEVPTAISLMILHYIIQAAMGWKNEHLWLFTVAKRHYSIDSGDDWGTAPAGDAETVLLRDVLAPRKTTIDYRYDFGDDWDHRLTITKRRPGDPALSYPRYVAGERNGPPEDCGGVFGFYDKLDALADRSHPDHVWVREWMGRYKPDVINERAIIKHLAEISVDLQPAKTTRTKRTASASKKPK